MQRQDADPFQEGASRDGLVMKLLLNTERAGDLIVRF